MNLADQAKKPLKLRIFYGIILKEEQWRKIL